MYFVQLVSFQYHLRKRWYKIPIPFSENPLTNGPLLSFAYSRKRRKASTWPVKRSILALLTWFQRGICSNDDEGTSDDDDDEVDDDEVDDDDNEKNKRGEKG